MRSYERAHNAVKGVDVVDPSRGAALGAALGPGSAHDQRGRTSPGTLNVLLAARDNGVRRVVMASSSSIYGSNAAMPKREDLLPQPISPYAVSKLAAEQYARAFAAVYGLETVALRYFNVFGPRQDPNSQYSGVVPRFMRLAVSRADRPSCTATASSRVTSPTSPTSSTRRSGGDGAGRRRGDLQHRLRRPEIGARPHRRDRPRLRPAARTRVRSRQARRRHALVRRHHPGAHPSRLRAELWTSTRASRGRSPGSSRTCPA